MPNDQEENIFEMAKQKSLLSFIETATHYRPLKQGKSYGLGFCPSCGEGSKHSNRVTINITAGGEVWHCKACSATGSIIDFAMLLWNCKDWEAANELCGKTQQRFAASTTLAPRREKTAADDAAEIKRQEAIAQVVSIIFREGHTHEQGCMKYLTVTRGLPEVVVAEAVRRGMLRFLPSNPHDAAKWLREHVGEGLLREAELWKPDKKMPGIAFRPLVGIIPGLKSAEFRLIHEPKEDEKKGLHYGVKEQPWFWEGCNTSKNRIVVVEGYINLLSLVAMRSQCSIIALPGVTTWVNRFEQWFANPLKHAGAQYLLALDNDDAGKTNNTCLHEQMKKCGIPSKIHETSFLGDANDFLRKIWNTGLKQNAA